MRCARCSLPSTCPGIAEPHQSASLLRNRNDSCMISPPPLVPPCFDFQQRQKSGRQQLRAGSALPPAPAGADKAAVTAAGFHLSVCSNTSGDCPRASPAAVRAMAGNPIPAFCTSPEYPFDPRRALLFSCLSHVSRKQLNRLEVKSTVLNKVIVLTSTRPRAIKIPFRFGDTGALLRQVAGLSSGPNYVVIELFEGR